jgi:hypothetical protein
MLWSVLLGLASGCNWVIGNEEGILDEADVWEPSPDEPDANVTPTPDSEAPDVPYVGEGAVEEAVLGVDVAATEVDAPSVDSNAKDAAKLDRVDDGKVDADGSRCDTGASVCVEGQVATEMQMCGPCGLGVRTRKRTCLAGGCGWGEWIESMPCSVTTAECMPGQTDTRSQACGPCNTGSQTIARRCTSACAWGAWDPPGECGNVTAECLPNHWKCCGAGKWEWCYTNTCKWTGGCAPCSDCGC